jgi:hypothetical protein
VLEHSVGLTKTLLAVKDDYERARHEGHAVGIACGIKNSGIGNGAQEWGKVRLVVERDDTVTLYNGYTEMGQGLLTVLTQCASTVTGLLRASSGPGSIRPTRWRAARLRGRGPRSSAGAPRSMRPRS